MLFLYRIPDAVYPDAGEERVESLFPGGESKSV
jgi:hypothetical protein